MYRSLAVLLSGLMLVAAPVWAGAPPWERVEAVQNVLDGETPVRGAIHLDLPLVSRDGSAVPLTVEVDSPMSEDDYVASIHLFAVSNPYPEIATIHLTPRMGQAKVATRVRLNESQRVVAVARTNTGRVYADAREVRVTVAGCLARDATYDSDTLMLARVRAPERFSAGEPGEVTTLINHPMETGLRKNGDGNLIPRRIVHRVAASVGAETVMEAELHRSVSADPYLRFFVAPVEDGTLTVRWDEEGGESAVREESLRLR